MVFRLPIFLYQVRLGGLLGQRMLLLHHVGRKTGKPRTVVLEVVERDEETNSFVVASGWGPKSAWYRNVLETPDVTIEVGRRTIAATALPLTKDEGAEIFVRYASRHPNTAKRVLPRLMGYSVDGSQEDFRQVGLKLPFVRLAARI